MAKASLLSLSLAFLLAFHGSCLARQSQSQQQQGNQCDIRRLNALEPSQRVDAEAGYTLFFDSNDQQFQCAGVEVLRDHIQPRGLFLPSYLNAPLLIYILQGRGIQGVVLPGCTETYQSSQQEFGGQQRLSQDRHQRIQQVQRGDVVAIPAGAAHWIYNNGNEELVAVALLDTSNQANQLDQFHRRFFLAGNPRQAQQQQGQQGQQQPWSRGQEGQQSQEEEAGNIFRGFGAEIIAEAFNVDRQTAERVQGQEDNRGHIVRVERGLEVIQPPMRREEQGPWGQDNGLEETICSTQFARNIDNPERADFYNPQAGRSTHLNSFKFPILRVLQLSAERGVLERNAMVAPHWIMNAHCVMYVTDGEMRVQIVNHQGEAVFDDQVREGQLVVVPQNFAVVQRAGEQGSRWISFRTNDNAMINTLAGRTSAMRGLPVDVVANAYQIPREQAQRLKFGREETHLFRPTSSSRFPGGRDEA